MSVQKDIERNNTLLKGGNCYLLLGTVEVDFHFPTITIHKMAKMPFIPDPRYSMDEERFLETARGTKI